MGIEKIKSKMTDDAEREAKKITNTAEHEAAKIRDSNKKIAEEYKKRRQIEIEAEAKLYKDKMLAQERVKVKRSYLNNREELINKFIREALENINRESKEYTSFMKEIVDNNIKSLSDEFTIYCNKADVSLLNRLVKNAKIKESPISGGAIFEDATRKIDESIDSRFDRLKNGLRQKISNIMGGQ